ncbi:MAG: hypothetical protein AAGC55_06785 [Myxococcota bacterium]
MQFAGALRDRLPDIEQVHYKNEFDDYYQISMHNAYDDDVALRLLRDGNPMVEFWDFDPQIDDDGGPTWAMAEYKRHSAIRVLSALTDAVGARFAYVTTYHYKHSEDRQHDFQEQIAAALAAFDNSDRAPFQAALREESWLWMVAVRKDEARLTECIERTLPSWDRVADSETSAVYEDRQGRPLFMNPTYSRRWNDSEPPG